ncbi:Membrane bound O-acyl transferase [Trypanosoma melophagium]|uniref:Membrane bound O-acyl transferase n=1 Tax=Trypanosoma melophagium TaxID=715481 RepID=UPI00351A669D|nr:Membrane bound O-acyl transferase [Trypanosoma melophagium]
MSVLRMIAFNTDMHEAIVASAEKREKVIEKHLNYCIECAKIRETYVETKSSFLPQIIDLETLGCYKLRTEYPRDPSEYNLLSYLGYIFYPPLFIAGPMSSFNAYISYLHNPTMAIDKERVKRYGIKAFSNLLILIVASHYMYIVAILMSEPVFSTISFPRRAVILYLMLGFLWLKFNCLWKLFRFLSLLDGIDVPEDMQIGMPHLIYGLCVICIFLWAVTRRSISIFFPFFFFIAIWHDIGLRLVHWAGIICVCFVIEILVSQFLFHPKSPLGIAMAQHPLLHRHVRIMGACLTMMELIIVNLVGFSIGLEKAGMNLKSMWRESPISFRVLMVIYFYIAASIAIQDRDQERFDEYQNRAKYSLGNRTRSNSTAGASSSYLRGEKRVSESGNIETPLLVVENGVDKWEVKGFT